MVTGVAEGLILPVKVENLLVQGREGGGVSQLPSHNNYRRVGQSHEMQAVCTDAVNRGDSNLKTTGTQDKRVGKVSNEREKGSPWGWLGTCVQ